MEIQAPQLINRYNALPNLDVQNQRSGEARGNVTGATTGLDVQLQNDKEAAVSAQGTTEISLSQVKSLSEIFNTYQAYVNQLEASDQTVNRITASATGMKDLLVSA